MVAAARRAAGRVHAPSAPVALALLVALALVLRLPTLDEQSFWLDEVYSARIAEGSFGHAWSTIQQTENTPPLFYLLGWLAVHVLGAGEWQLRLVSGLAGGLAVLPVAALARRVGGEGPAWWPGGSGRGVPDHPGSASAMRNTTAGAAHAEAVPDHPHPTAAIRSTTPGVRLAPLAVGLAAGLLVAVNPLAHWFSQEARSYGLLLLTSALAWAALAAALDRPDPRRLWLWALAAVAAAWTHYFGAILLVAGGVALVVRAWRTAGPAPSRATALRPLAAPLLASLVGAAALAPIALNQQSTSMYEAIAGVKSLGDRIIETPKQFAVGYNAPADIVLGVLVALALVVLVGAGAWPRRRTAAADHGARGAAAGRGGDAATAAPIALPRRTGLLRGRVAGRGTVLLALVAVVWVVPLLGLLVDFDLVLTRNYVVLMPPLAALAAVGAWRIGRRGVLLLGAVALVQWAVVAAVAFTPAYQRDDWRGALREATAGMPGPELLAVSRYQGIAATYYLPDAKQIYDLTTPTPVRTVAVVDRPADAGDDAPSLVPAPPIGGMRLVRQVGTSQYRVYVWRADRPIAFPPLVALQLFGGGPAAPSLPLDQRRAAVLVP
ncbi:hypothetical protein [Patulibacter sp. SYSU D01012]|uniref:hypothetical protein n=1 Tax=Patulibacter sp. SYSU D01012 TaxID=2817381 RepID=UPI001B30ED43|nr:hypothetical protein [Patulibacter sp. SYSU D01012]